MPVQFPEGTDPKREACKDGYATLCDISGERIRRAGNKTKSDLDEPNHQLMLSEELKQPPDIGSHVFTLDDFGIERLRPGKLTHEMVKPNRTGFDIIFGMTFKWGLEPTLPVEKSDAADYPVWSVACDKLVCCMSPGLTIEALKAIIGMELKCVLTLDSILNDTLKLNAAQIFRHASEHIGTDVEPGAV